MHVVPPWLRSPSTLWAASKGGTGQGRGSIDSSYCCFAAPVAKHSWPATAIPGVLQWVVQEHTPLPSSLLLSGQWLQQLPPLLLLLPLPPFTPLRFLNRPWDLPGSGRRA